MKRHTSCRIHEMFFQYHYLNQFEESYSPHFLQKTRVSMHSKIIKSNMLC